MYRKLDLQLHWKHTFKPPLLLQLLGEAPCRAGVGEPVGNICVIFSVLVHQLVQGLLTHSYVIAMS